MIQFGWGDYEHTYGVLTFKGQWTSNEFAAIIRSMYEEIRLSRTEVCLMVDMRQSATPPPSVLSIASHAYRARPENCRHIIVISKSGIWKRLFGVISKGIPSHSTIQFVQSVDEAYSRLVASTGG